MSFKLKNITLYVTSLVFLTFASISYTTLSAEVFSESDNLIAKNWFFGHFCSLVFTPNGIQSVNSSAMKTEEGVCSISDNSGKLVFYSNGVRVFNKDNKVIENADSLLGHKSTTQSVLSVKKPNSQNLYYIFTMANIGRTVGFNYSVLDIQANNGEGKLINKNIKIDSNVTERLAATKHFDRKRYWIATRDIKSKLIKVYLLNDKGLVKSPVTNEVARDSNNNNTYSTIGQMKFSPNGNKLAIATFGTSLVEIFDFDKKTGKLSNPIYIENQHNQGAYGLEFSPNSRFLYVSFQINSAIIKYDLISNNVDKIKESEEIIATNNDNYFFGSLQLTPNYQIIVAENEERSVGLITSPNDLNICTYLPSAIKFETATCAMGLPNFESNLFDNYNNSEFSLVDDNKIEEQKLVLVANAKIRDTVFANSYYNLKHKSLTLTGADGYEAGAIWSKNKVDITNFDSYFVVKLSKGDNRLQQDGSPKGADGFTFVFQNESNNVIGESAAGIGYKGIKKSLAIEFDCFNNNIISDGVFDEDGNHIAVFSNKSFPNSNNHQSTANLITLPLSQTKTPFLYSDSNYYYVRVTYKNKQLKIYFDDINELKNAVINLSIDLSEYLGENQSYIGITAATGSAVQECEVIKWNYFSDPSLVSSFLPENSVIEQFNNFSIKTNSLSFSSNTYGDFTLQVVDETGREFFTQNIFINVGINSLDFNSDNNDLQKNLFNNKLLINFKNKLKNQSQTYKVLFAQ